MVLTHCNILVFWGEAEKNNSFLIFFFFQIAQLKKKEMEVV